MGIFLKSKKNIFCLAILVILASSSMALAVDWPDSPVGTTLDPDGSKTGERSELGTLIQYLYEWGISLGGLAVFIALLIAGFQYLTSAGNPTLMADAMGRMRSAGIGLVLLLGSYLILYTINPELTTFRPLSLDLEDIKEELGACTTDEYCEEKFGENYKCAEGFCVQDFEMAMEPNMCDSVVVRWGAKSTTIPKGDYDDSVDIAKGESFSIEPWKGGEISEKCMANVGFYSDIKTGFLWFGKGCDKEKESQSIYIMENVEREGIVANQNIRCIEFQEY